MEKKYPTLINKILIKKNTVNLLKIINYTYNDD